MNALHTGSSLAALLIAQPFLQRLIFASLELAVLALAIYAAVKLFRVRSPRLVFLLWLVVLLKPLFSLTVGSPLPIVSFQAPAPEMSVSSESVASAVSKPSRPDTRPLLDSPPARITNLGSTGIAKKPSLAVSTISGRSIAWPQALLAAWLAGVALFLLRYAAGRMRLHRMIQSAIPPSSKVATRYSQLAAELGIKHPPRLLITADLESPALVGLLKPAILLPDWLAAENDLAKLDWPLRHELTHWKWRDPLALMAHDVALLLFHFHPAAWWAGKRMTEAMELACDRAMLRDADAASDYAEELFRILKKIQHQRRPAVAGGLFAARTQISKRIATLLDGSFARVPHLTAFSVAAVVAIAAGAFSVGIAVGSGEEAKAPAARVLHFPKGRSVGRVRLRDEGRYGVGLRDTLGHWEDFAPARGKIGIPEGKEIYLTIRLPNSKDVSFLDRLAPDDLYALSSNTDHDGLTHIERLTGLKALLLTIDTIDDEDLRVISRFSSLRFLHLKGSSFTAKGLSYLTNLPNLQFFRAWRSDFNDKCLAFNDECLAELGKITTLTGLQLNRGSYTDKSIAHLQNLTNLRYFNASRDHPVITDSALAHLANFTRLESLSLQNQPITDEGLIHLTRMTSMRRLNLHGTQVTEKGIRILAPLRSLETLTFPENIAPAVLVNFPSLKELGGEQRNDEALAQATQFKNLVSLNIGNDCTDAGMSHVAAMKQLETLYFNNNAVTDVGFAKLTGFDSLKTLYLNNTEVTDEGLRHLKNFPALEHLYIARLRDTGAGLIHLRQLPPIRWLEIQYPKMRNKDLAYIPDLPSLTSLTLRGPITDAGLVHLSRLTHLKRLRLGGSHITGAGIAHLLPLQRLEFLSVDGNLSDDAVEHLVQLESLRDLTIGGTLSDTARERLESLPFMERVTLEDPPYDMIHPKPAVGQIAPDFAVTTLDGKTLRLDDYRGKVVLLYFYGTWCSPCVAATPKLKELYEELRALGEFEMISFSFREPEEKPRAHVEKHSLAWPQVAFGQDLKVVEAYGVLGAPHYFLIGPDGKVLTTELGQVKAIAASILGSDS